MTMIQWMPANYHRVYNSKQPSQSFANEQRTVMPKSNIVEKEDGWQIQLAVPGVSREEIKIQIENNELLVSSEAGTGDEAKYTLREFEKSGFKRSYTLSDKIDQTGIAAVCKNGVLSIDIPRKEAFKKVQRAIAVQ